AARSTRAPDLAPGVGAGAPARRVASRRQLQQSDQREVSALGAPDLLEDGDTPGHSLETAPAAAATERSLFVHRGVADLARCAHRTSIELPRRDDAGPDPRGRLDVDDLRMPAPCAPVDLAQGSHLGAVVDPARRARPVRHLIGRRQTAPAGQDAGRADGPGAAIDWTRNAHPNADHALAANTGVGQDLADHSRCGSQGAGCVVVHLKLAVPLHGDLMRQVGHAHSDVAVTEVDSDCRAGRVVEAQTEWRTSAWRGAPARRRFARPVSEFGDEARCTELEDKG